MKKIFLLTTVFIFILHSQGQIVSTLAGSGTKGYVDGTGATAQFATPTGLAVDATGNVYVADYNNNKIRKINPTGNVTTLAGSGIFGYKDGQGTEAQFMYLNGLVTDVKGNVYVADLGNYRIRKITPNGEVSTFAGSGVVGLADGQGLNAQFSGPAGLTIDLNGNLYVTDSQRIRKITPDGVVSTIAGSGIAGYVDGPGNSAKFFNPGGIAIDVSGNLFVMDSDNSKVRKISATGEVSTLSGSDRGFADGVGLDAKFNTASSLTIDAQGYLFVADSYNHRIRKITSTGVVSTFSGSVSGFSDGDISTALFKYPDVIASDINGNLYVSASQKIRKITLSPSGIDKNIIISSIKVYPNPVDKELSIETPYTDTLNKIIITDLTGKMVFNQTGKSNLINVEKLSKGVYILEVIFGINKTKTKFVKE
jgi:serine/threonine protein kinase, bacterial